MSADALELLLLLGGEALASRELGKRPVYPLLGGQQGFLVPGGVFDHGDNLHQGLVVAQLVGLLEQLDRKMLGGGCQLGP